MMEKIIRMMRDKYLEGKSPVLLGNHQPRLQAKTNLTRESAVREKKASFCFKIFNSKYG